MPKEKTNKAINQGVMVYLSQNPCLERDATRFYDALIDLQKTIGCKYKKVKENDSQFDRFVGQTYIKGMTHRNDGRTIIILGKDHHGTAGQGYFNMDPQPYENKTGKGFGDLVRWGHLGDSLDDGAILVDFEMDANTSAGVTRTPQEVQQLLRWLSNYHFNSGKEVYLTESARIYEPGFGTAVRSMGIRTLEDWTEHEFDKVYSHLADGIEATEMPTRKKRPTRKRTVKKCKPEEHNYIFMGRARGGSLCTSSLW